jgi:hypothetical protein
VWGPSPTDSSTGGSVICTSPWVQTYKQAVPSLIHPPDHGTLVVHHLSSQCPMQGLCPRFAHKPAPPLSPQGVRYQPPTGTHSHPRPPTGTHPSRPTHPDPPIQAHQHTHHTQPEHKGTHGHPQAPTGTTQSPHCERTGFGRFPASARVALRSSLPPALYTPRGTCLVVRKGSAPGRAS